jgi:hypothetical protein
VRARDMECKSKKGVSEREREERRKIKIDN